VSVPDFGRGRWVNVAVRKTAAGQGASAIAAVRAAAPGAEFVIAVDESADLDDWRDVLFHLCANTDPGRDLHADGPRIAFDATRKLPGDERHGQPVRRYPPIIAMDDATRQRIRARARELGL